jgi:hypothetical protein
MAYSRVAVIGSTALAAVVGARVVSARHKRASHRRRRSFRGHLEVWGGDAGAPLLDDAGSYGCTVRVSKGAATPTGWPNVRSLAIRVAGGDGDRPVDLLLSTAGRGRILRRAPVPRRHFDTVYSSILPFRLNGRKVRLAALPDGPLGTTLDAVDAVAGRHAARFVLAVAGGRGPWQDFGRVTFGDRLSDETDAKLAFDPLRSPARRLDPAGPAKRLRRAAYRRSQRWRGAR